MNYYFPLPETVRDHVKLGICRELGASFEQGVVTRFQLIELRDAFVCKKVPTDQLQKR